MLRPAHIGLLITAFCAVLAGCASGASEAIVTPATTERREPTVTPKAVATELLATPTPVVAQAGPASPTKTIELTSTAQLSTAIISTPPNVSSQTTDFSTTFMEGLTFAPASTVKLEFIDWELLKRDIGAQHLTGMNTLDEIRSLAPEIYKHAVLYGYEMTGMGNQAVYGPDGWSFNALDHAWELTLRKPQVRILKLRSDYDMAPLLARFTPRGYTVDPRAGGTIYSYPRPYSDYADGWSEEEGWDKVPWLIFHPEMWNVGIIEDQRVLVLSMDQKNVEEVLNTYAGKAPSLLDDPITMGTVRKLGKVTSALIHLREEACQLSISSQENENDNPRWRERILAPYAGVVMRPYMGFGLGFAYDGEHHLGRIIMTYDDATSAQADLQQRRSLAEGRTTGLLQYDGTPVPYSKHYFSVENATVQDSSIVITVRPIVGAENGLLKVLRERMTFAVCP